MFLRGRVTAADGAPVPNDALVERVCNAQVRQQVHISPSGEFSMQLGSRVDSMTDASGNGPSQRELASRKTDMGIPRQELTGCELRASVAGFSSSVINLVDLSGSLSNVEVGAIVVRRRGKIDNSTISASAYKAPKEAISAYEKGVDAQRKGKPANARKYFEKAVEIYPAYTNAWFQLGTILEKAQQQDEARTAFTKATSIDSRFLPPYLSLASMAYAGQNWTDVLSYTNHILDVDPLSHMPGYVLDMDSASYTQACFYNALANYRLNRLAEAEKSGMKTVHMDLETHFPQVHLLLAEIFEKKNDYNTAIVEIRTYLEYVPHGKNAEQVRERLAQLEKVNAS
ncbi:MAG: tetratricopeptide repeat protein, partial [Acidobacteriota bacterium]|nr:tetratricopeptide repeat protein [Acidobacteriota bacterium]